MHGWHHSWLQDQAVLSTFAPEPNWSIFFKKKKEKKKRKKTIVGGVKGVEPAFESIIIKFIEYPQTTENRHGSVRYSS